MIQNGGQNGAPNRLKSIKDRVWKQGPKKIAKKCENWDPRTLKNWALAPEGFNFSLNPEVWKKCQQWLQNGSQNGTKIDENWCPEVFQKLIQKMSPKSYQNELQRGTQRVPKIVPNPKKWAPGRKNKDFRKESFSRWLPGGSWAPFWLHFWSFFDVFLTYFLIVF